MQLAHKTLTKLNVNGAIRFFLSRIFTNFHVGVILMAERQKLQGCCVRDSTFFVYLSKFFFPKSHLSIHYTPRRRDNK